MTDSGIDSPCPSEANHDEEAFEISRLSSYKGPSRLLHWGPLLAIGIISWISIFAVYCDLMYWPIHKTGGTMNLSLFLTWVGSKNCFTTINRSFVGNVVYTTCSINFLLLLFHCRYSWCSITIIRLAL